LRLHSERSRRALGCVGAARCRVPEGAGLGSRRRVAGARSAPGRPRGIVRMWGWRLLGGWERWWSPAALASVGVRGAGARSRVLGAGVVAGSAGARTDGRTRLLACCRAAQRGLAVAGDAARGTLLCLASGWGSSFATCGFLRVPDEPRTPLRLCARVSGIP